MTHNQSLPEFDPEVAALIDAELNRQQTTLEMIASENFAPVAAMQAQGTVLTNKYAEGKPRHGSDQPSSRRPRPVLDPGSAVGVDSGWRRMGRPHGRTDKRTRSNGLRRRPKRAACEHLPRVAAALLLRRRSSLGFLPSASALRLERRRKTSSRGVARLSDMGTPERRTTRRRASRRLRGDMPSRGRARV